MVRILNSKNFSSFFFNGEINFLGKREVKVHSWASKQMNAYPEPRWKIAKHLENLDET